MVPSSTLAAQVSIAPLPNIVGSVFNPRSFGNLVLWLDAEALRLADSASVASWTDRSGSAAHAVQSTGTKNPTFKTGILNSRPIVRFDGTTDGMATPSLVLAAYSAVTMFAVVGNVGSPGANQVISEFSPADSGVTDAFQLFLNTSFQAVARAIGNVGNSTAQAGVTITTTAKVISVVLDKTQASASEQALWIDGSNAATTKPSSANNTNGFGSYAMNIGARNNAASLFLSGDLAEYLLYGGALSTGARQAVEAYLKAKWGTA